MKRVALVLVMAMAILGAVGLPTLVGAEPVSVEGKGILAAKGTGMAKIEGKLEFRGNARAAVLIVEDKAGDARIDVWGYKQRVDEGEGRVRYVGFNGGAHITGSDVAITLAGANARFVVRGVGSATLKGQGIYKVRGLEIKPWTSEGAVVDFGS